MQKSFEDILAQYDLLKQRHMLQEERRHRQLLSLSPKLRELEDQRIDCNLQLLAASVYPTQNADKREIQGQIQKLAGEIQQERKRLEEEYPYNPQYACPVCGDTGMVMVQGEKQFCQCMKDKIYQQLYGGRDVPGLKGSFESFDETLFSDLPVENRPISQRQHMLKIKRLFLKFAHKYPGVAKRDILLYGNAGLGKTFLLEALAKELFAQEKDILFLSAYNLFDVFHSHRMGELELIWPIFEVPILLIDDLGTEPMTKNVTVEYLFRLLNERLLHQKTTIIGTNLTLEGLMERYGERILSRLAEKTRVHIFQLYGKDIRMIRGPLSKEPEESES